MKGPRQVSTSLRQASQSAAIAARRLPTQQQQQNPELGHLAARPAASLLTPPRPHSPSHSSLRVRVHNNDNATARRSLGTAAAATARQLDHAASTSQSSNPALAFPCLDKIESRSATLAAARRSRTGIPSSATMPAVFEAPSASSGPEPSYTTGATLSFRSTEPLLLDWGGVLHEFTLAYETWGTLNPSRTNAVLLHTGLSASSHAASTERNPQPGWWEKFIGPGRALDTDRYFVVCTNVLGGCYGSTGPSSVDPADGARYATRFPILTVEDMVRAQFRLLDALGIRRLHASVGSSLGGMQSLAAGALFPHRVGRVVSVSGCARSHPYSIAMRHTQRQVLMMDPNWNRGFYYDADRVPPHAGMKLAREIATVTYRSGPEWEQRFGRRRADPAKPPALCPDFLIETYLDHAGEKFCLTYDPNSLLYVSKAMDMFDLGRENQRAAAARRAQHAGLAASSSGGLTLPDRPYEEQPTTSVEAEEGERQGDRASRHEPAAGEPSEDLVAGLAPMRDHPALIMGVASDILFPAWQQREVAEALRRTGNTRVTHYELGEEQSLFGHDTFLLDIQNVGGSIGRFLAEGEGVE